MKTILIATDYSKGANNALDYAAALAKGMEARLVIFNAFNLSTPSSSVPFDVPNISDLISENKVRLSKIGEEIARMYNIVVECVTSNGLVLDSLNYQVKKQKADLVVMGMQGNSFITRFFGSTTTSVIKQAKYPVLVVPVDASFRGIRRILFACDYQYLSKNSWLDPIYELAAAYKAQVEILHVEKDADLIPIERKSMLKNAPNMEELLRGIKHTYRYLYEEEVMEGIKRGIDEFHADIVAMVPHKLSFWESIFNPSLTKKMALHSYVPLLALPNIAKPKSRKKVAKPVKVSL